MSEQATTMSLLDRLRWWLYARCLAYCARIAYAEADPSEVCLMDTTYFVAVEKGEIREMIEETPDLAWRFEGRL